MFNTRKKTRRPLTPLEQFIMDYVWAHPDSTAEACREGVAVLRKLEEKGYVTHSVDGRTFVYRAAHTQRNVAVEAAQQLIDRFCGGSVEELLVGLVDHQVLEPKQLRKLAETIAARKEKRV
jgi:predicted transcriptional regulator